MPEQEGSETDQHQALRPNLVAGWFPGLSVRQLGASKSAQATCSAGPAPLQPTPSRSKAAGAEDIRPRLRTLSRDRTEAARVKGRERAPKARLSPCSPHDIPAALCRRLEQRRQTQSLQWLRRKIRQQGWQSEPSVMEARDNEPVVAVEADPRDVGQGGKERDQCKAGCVDENRITRACGLGDHDLLQCLAVSRRSHR